MNPAHVLVVGSGGREHALAWRMAADAHAPRVDVAPGNDGTALRFAPVAAAVDDGAALLEACRARAVDLVVIGPETALAAGVADVLRAGGIHVFGPGREAARLEASKWYAKELMQRANVPTAPAEVFPGLDEARAALARFGPPWVLKADGLAAGKGVLVTHERDAALAFLDACLERGRFGESGRRVLLERFLPGEEASVVAICDGEQHVLLPAARDHKRAFDGDAGPNTGGMGAYAPHAALDAAGLAAVSERIVTPVLRELAARGTPFRGALYCGLMLDGDGARVVEFNVRFGDPETQAVLPLVAGSFSTLLASAAAGRLAPEVLALHSGACVSVALVDEGYPEANVGGAIEGLEALAEAGVLVFHAGTRRDGASWRLAGGRAAYVTARGADVEDARRRAYDAIGRLRGRGWRCRGDVARAAVSVGG